MRRRPPEADRPRLLPIPIEVVEAEARPAAEADDVRETLSQSPDTTVVAARTVDDRKDRDAVTVHQAGPQRRATQGDAAERLQRSIFEGYPYVALELVDHRAFDGKVRSFCSPSRSTSSGASIPRRAALGRSVRHRRARS